MTNVSLFNTLNTSIYNVLSGGTALTTALGGTAIYHGEAPSGKALPYVVWNYQYGGVENITPHEMSTQLVYIRAFASSASQGGTIDAAICNLLHKETLTVTGWSNFWLARETEIAMPEKDAAGITTWSIGAFYRIRLDKS